MTRVGRLATGSAGPVLDGVVLAVETRGLAERYGAVAALEDFDLRVPRHSVFGCLAQDPGFYETQSARETLHFAARFFHRRPARAVLLTLAVWRVRREEFRT